MITNKDFIVFSDDWGRHPFSCQHIMKHFLPKNRILWVNTVGLRSPGLNAYDVKRSIEKIISFCRKKDYADEYPRNLWVLNPFMIPYNKIGMIRSFNQHSVVGHIRSFIEKKGFRDPVVVVTVPNAADYIKALAAYRVIYYCVDDFTQYPKMDSDLVADMEEVLLDLSDLVIATSRDLCRKKERKGKQPRFLPQGVDFDHFKVARHPVPEAMKNIHRPIAGFFGVVSHWLDIELIRKLAASYPNCSFVFIGPSDIDLAVFEDLKNIHFLGKVPYDDLPRYAVQFDLGIIPFSIDDFTRSVNPLKLLEYLACGLPVVSTDMPEVRYFSDVVHIAQNFTDFQAGFERALQDHSLTAKEARQNIAQKYSWQSIAEQFSTFIENTIGI